MYPVRWTIQEEGIAYSLRLAFSSIEYIRLKDSKQTEMMFVYYLLFYATFPESFLPSLGSITTPSLVEIMVFSLLIEADNELSCFSSLISR